MPSRGGVLIVGERGQRSNYPKASYPLKRGLVAEVPSSTERIVAMRRCQGVDSLKAPVLTPITAFSTREGRQKYQRCRFDSYTECSTLG